MVLDKVLILEHLQSFFNSPLIPYTEIMVTGEDGDTSLPSLPFGVAPIDMRNGDVKSDGADYRRIQFTVNLFYPGSQGKEMYKELELIRKKMLMTNIVDENFGITIRFLDITTRERFVNDLGFPTWRSAIRVTASSNNFAIN